LYTDLKTYLPGDILVKVDRMSMANALEVRAPILDHKIIELAAKIPIHYKYDKGVKKQILKKAFEKILPSDILNRKKMGFSVPMADWFRGELKQISSELFFSTASGLGYFFNISEIKKIWEDHQRQKHNYGGLLWSLLMFELWHKRFFK
jgi:asparagine synthase (glutamine-hydrolysing)